MCRPPITGGQGYSGTSEMAANGTAVGHGGDDRRYPDHLQPDGWEHGVNAFVIDNAGNIAVNDTTQLDFDTDADLHVDGAGGGRNILHHRDGDGESGRCLAGHHGWSELQSA